MGNKAGAYHDVTNVEIVGDYLLRLTFDDDTQQVIDFRPLLAGPLFGPLADLEQFNQVRLNVDTGTIEWPTGADFNPTLLHDWPHHQEQAQILANLRQQRFTPPPGAPDSVEMLREDRIANHEQPPLD